MKKSARTNKKLALQSHTIRKLAEIAGGRDHPHSYYCPSQDPCPQHTDATCFSDCGDCGTIVLPK